MEEVTLFEGNQALAEAAVRAGVDAYFGYPITPQSEIIEYLMSLTEEQRRGMVVLQAESEIASIYMLYGAAGCGKKVMTTSSSPGISLMMEGISYIAGAELPCLVVNVARGGPGLGTIQPSQSDYFQAVKGGGHGDYKLIVLAPASVQEMADFVPLAFELAFRYRNPAMILTDGAIGQMMEKVVFSPPLPKNNSIPDWATSGKPANRERNIIKSLRLDPLKQEAFNLKLVEKYKEMERNEVRFEKINCDDAEWLFIAYGTCARVCLKAVQEAREKGIKIGLLRPITLFPFPKKEIEKMTRQVKGILTVEMSAGQMVEDVRLAVNGKISVEYYGRIGGIIPTPLEVLHALEKYISAF